MKKTIAIIILIIICLGLGGYIAYDKLYAEKQVEKEPTEEKNVEEKKEELAPWLDYLLNTDGVKIKNIKGNSIDFEGDTGRHDGELTIEELKDILTEEVVKFIDPCGRGGIFSDFNIVYEKNGVEYEISPWNANSNIEDKEFITVLEKSVTKVDESKEEIENNENSECTPKTIIDIYYDDTKLLDYLTD